MAKCGFCGNIVEKTRKHDICTGRYLYTSTMGLGGVTEYRSTYSDFKLHSYEICTDCIKKKDDKPSLIGFFILEVLWLVGFWLFLHPEIKISIGYKVVIFIVGTIALLVLSYCLFSKLNSSLGKKAIAERMAEILAEVLSDSEKVQKLRKKARELHSDGETYAKIAIRLKIPKEDVNKLMAEFVSFSPSKFKQMKEG